MSNCPAREVTRRMRGEVTVRAECLMPEKLLERVLTRGARFDAVRLEGDHALIVDCDAASAQILLDQCERFHLPAGTLNRRGRSAFIEYARRWVANHTAK